MPTLVLVETIETAFGIYLLSSAAVRAAVALDEKNLPAIYANRGLQDSGAQPYISWRFDKNTEEQLVGGPPDVLDAEVLISCYAKNYDVVKSVGWAVKTFLRFLQVPVRFGSQQQYVLYDNWVIDSIDSTEANTIGLFESIIQVGLQVQFDLPPGF